MFEWFKRKSVELSKKNIKECLEELITIANRAHEHILQTGKENPSDIETVNRAKTNLIIQLCGPIPLDEVKERFINPILEGKDISEGARIAICHAYDSARQNAENHNAGVVRDIESEKLNSLVKTFLSKIKTFEDTWLQDFWSRTLCTSEKCLHVLFDQSSPEVSFSQNITEQELLFWFKKTSLCLISWSYYCSSEENLRSFVSKNYLQVGQGFCSGKIVDSYEQVFGELVDWKELAGYFSLGLQHDTEGKVVASENKEETDERAVSERAVKNCYTIGNQLLQKVWHENNKHCEIPSGYGVDWTFDSCNDPILKKSLIIGLRLWLAFEGILQPFLVLIIPPKAL